MRTMEMLGTHPRRPQLDRENLTNCITACTECADTCTICADACLGEEMVQRLRKCIRLNLDCADVCQTTARVLSRLTDADPQFMRLQLETCSTACRLCAEQCESHADAHEHCKICAASCRNCETVCLQVLEMMEAESGPTI